MTESYDPLATVQAAGPPGTISFIYGLPDPVTFPVDELRAAAGRVLKERPELALQYGPEQGYGPLIDHIRGRLLREEGLDIDRSRLMLTGGSSQTLDHFCTLFTRPGDLALVEAPTYHETLQLFRDHGLRLAQIPIDDGGLVVEALEERLAALAKGRDRARFLYTIPNYQNPSGITLRAKRRGPVLELAEKYDFLVVEDDVYRELAYERQPPTSLFALAAAKKAPNHGGRVLRVGSFSKTLAPGLRMGWLVAPPDVLNRFIDSGLRCMGGGANPLIANLLADYCGRGLLEPHIEELCAVYRERRDVMLEALADNMPAGVCWTRPGGGFFVWLTLPKPLRAKSIVERARAAGVWLLSGDPFFAESPTGQHLRLAFSYVAPGRIREGIEILGQVIGASGQNLPADGESQQPLAP